MSPRTETENIGVLVDFPSHPMACAALNMAALAAVEGAGGSSPPPTETGLFAKSGCAVGTAGEGHLCAAHSKAAWVHVGKGRRTYTGRMSSSRLGRHRGLPDDRLLHTILDDVQNMQNEQKNEATHRRLSDCRRHLHCEGEHLEWGQKREQNTVQKARGGHPDGTVPHLELRF